MATISKVKLSGSTDGRPVIVAANSSAGTTIHTGSGTATTYDEIWLWATNYNTSTETLVIQWGGTAGSDSMITTINPNETVLVAPGWLIKGNASTALIVKAYSTTANKVNITGYINQIVA
jgi:hypothetical protein